MLNNLFTYHFLYLPRDFSDINNHFDIYIYIIISF